MTVENGKLAFPGSYMCLISVEDNSNDPTGKPWLDLSSYQVYRISVGPDNFLWAKTWGGLGDDYGHDVAIDGSGNAYVTGWFYDITDFDPGPGVDNHTSNGEGDAFLSKFDSSGSLQWTKAWGGTGWDSGISIGVDGSGNTYVSGLFLGTVDFDPGTGVDNHTSNGDADLFLSKFDSSGNFVWTKTWGGSDWDFGYGVAVDGSGNAYVSGLFIDTVDLDPGPGVDNHTSNGSEDVFLSKFDSSGNFQWAKTWGGVSDDSGCSITVDGSGNAYVPGYFYDTVDFDPGPGVDNHASNGDSDIFLSKFDSSGNFQWAKTWGGEWDDSGYGVAVDGTGNAYVTGQFSGYVDFNPDIGVDFHIYTGLYGAYDIFLSKFDSSGNFQWAKTWGGEWDDSGYAVAVDSTGNAFVTGAFYGNADLDPGPGKDVHTSIGSEGDVFLSKFNSSGDFLWARTWGGNDYGGDVGFGVAADGSGHAYVTGYFEDTFDFDPGPGEDIHTSNGGGDAFLSKFEP